MDIAKNNSTFPLFGFSQFGVPQGGALATNGEQPPHSSENYTTEVLDLWPSGLLAHVTAATVAFSHEDSGNRAHICWFTQPPSFRLAEIRYYFRRAGGDTDSSGGTGAVVHAGCYREE